MTTKNKEINIDQIYSLSTSWYYSEINSLADAAVEACVGRMFDIPPESDIEDLRGRDRESAIASWVPRRLSTYVSASGIRVPIRERDEGRDPRRFLETWIEATLDEHEFVIYTRESHLALLASSNDDAYTEADASAALPQRCFFAMRADLWKALEARSNEWDISDEDDSDPDPSCGCDDNAWCALHMPRETITMTDVGEPDDTADRLASEARSLIEIGDRVVAPAALDTDRGRVISMGDLECEVAWDSGVSTWTPIAGLVPESEYVPVVMLAIEALRESESDDLPDGERCFVIEIAIDGVKTLGQISLCFDADDILRPMGDSLDCWVSWSLRLALDTLPDALRRVTIGALEHRQEGIVTI